METRQIRLSCPGAKATAQSIKQYSEYEFAKINIENMNRQCLWEKIIIYKYCFDFFNIQNINMCNYFIDDSQ